MWSPQDIEEWCCGTHRRLVLTLLIWEHLLQHEEGQHAHNDPQALDLVMLMAPICQKGTLQPQGLFPFVFISSRCLTNKKTTVLVCHKLTFTISYQIFKSSNQNNHSSVTVQIKLKATFRKHCLNIILEVSCAVLST